MIQSLADTPLASRAWRLSNLYTIRDSNGQLVPFRPNLAQRKYYNSQWYGNHVLKARKLGFSTFFEIENLDFLLFNPGLTAGIIDVGLDDAKEKLNMLRLAYENLDNGDIHPDTYQLGALIKRQIRFEEDAKERLVFNNDSRVRCSTSLRGATPNRIHWSEAGKTAIFFPKKAEEIINGALNSITPGNVANIESTHEGGRFGSHFRLLRQSMKLDPAKLTKVDRKFHFFPWWDDPRYVLDEAIPIRPEILKYFAQLSKTLDGHTFTRAQMLWYDKKQAEQGHGMKKEFPSTPGEAFEAVSEHAIYGRHMADLRAAGRICEFGKEAGLPCFTFWDIGLSDYTSIWLVQPVGRFFLVLDWQEWEGEPGSMMAEHLRAWESKWGITIAGHYVPHDAARRSPNDGKSYLETLNESGLRNVQVVPRTPDIWLGIGYTRDILPACWFNATACDTERIHNGEEFPSGVACLEGYSKDISATGSTLREMPKHDVFSHSADAFRTFAEAWKRGMVAPQAEHKPRAVASRKPRGVRR